MEVLVQHFDMDLVSRYLRGTLPVGSFIDRKSPMLRHILIEIFFSSGLRPKHQWPDLKMYLRITNFHEK